MLGYESHAAYIQEIRMAKDPASVKKFLSELATKLVGLWQEEKEIMIKMKEEEARQLGFEFDGKLNFWDIK